MTSNEIIKKLQEICSPDKPVLFTCFSNAKDKKILRLNSKVAFLAQDIYDLYKLIELSGINNYTSMNVFKLDVYIIVYPDRLNSTEVTRTVHNFHYGLFKVYICTYDDFFKLVVGNYEDNILPKTIRESFLTKLGDSIFIFEDINWTLLNFLFRFSGIILSGGSNTKRHILSPIEFKLSQFLFCVYNNGTALNAHLDYLYNLSLNDEFSNNKKGMNILLKEGIKLKKKNIEKVLDSFFNKQTVTRNFMGDSDVNFKEYALQLKIRIYRDRLIFIKKLDLSDRLVLDSKDLSKIGGSKREYHTSCFKNKNSISDPCWLKSSRRRLYSQFTYINKNFKRSFNNLSPFDNEPLQKVSSASESPINNTPKFNSFDLYLEKIGEIISNSNYSPQENQQIIENRWVDIIRFQYESLDYIQKRHSHSFIKKIPLARETLNTLNENNITKRKFPTLYQYLNNPNLLLLTYGVAIKGVQMGIGYTNVCSIIGKKVVHYIYMENIIINKTINILEPIVQYNKIHATFNEFMKEIELSDNDLIKLGDFLLDILMRYPSDIFERTFESEFKNITAKIQFNESKLEEIKDNLIVEPASFPMICEPAKWSDDNYGGYLNNQFIKSDIITGSTYHNHKMLNRGELYNSINYMSSIKFSFNKALLDYLDNQGKFLLEDKNLLKETTSSLDKHQREIQLKVAKIYSKTNLPIYIPLQADWRGRIYTMSFFANYQGDDLALSLLQFWEGPPLNESGLYYLNIYGANIYNENNISKDTYEKRIKWTEDNMDNILKMDNDFMLKAENKFVFAAFCLLKRELNKNPKIPVKFPILLDATCSGIQHLAALIKDVNLARQTNLINQEDDSPSDIYEKLRKPINEEIRRVGREETVYSSLATVDLTRKNIKTPIMTKTYNVTQRGIREQLINSFEKNHEEVKSNKQIKLYNIKYQVPSIIPGKTIELSLVEIGKIAEIINNTIFTHYPGLNIIYNYFISMVKLLNKLGLPVVWLTPSGLELTQNYLKFKKSKLGLTLGGRSISLVLKEKLNKIDKGKQSLAIIPNIIHSLDASHLMQVIIKAYESETLPIITVHDCFGTHPNSMHNLYNIVKIEFIKTYLSVSFIDKFHKRTLQSISDNGYIIEKDEIEKIDYVKIRKTKIYIPNKPDLGDLDLNQILNSKYMIM